ncbi:MAG: single-stranded DNA-binding protein [bacterium]
MARGFNRVLLIGNLTRDPELRYTPSNTAVADLGLAVNRNYRDASGETQEDVTFVDITVWGRTAENCSQYLSKGSPVFVEGRLTLDQWENNEGQRRSKLKVTAQRVDFLGSPGGASGQQQGASRPADETPEDILEDVTVEETEDDVPF